MTFGSLGAGSQSPGPLLMVLWCGWVTVHSFSVPVCLTVSSWMTVGLWAQTSGAHGPQRWFLPWADHRISPMVLGVGGSQSESSQSSGVLTVDFWMTMGC